MQIVKNVDSVIIFKWFRLLTDRCKIVV